MSPCILIYIVMQCNELHYSLFVDGPLHISIVTTTVTLALSGGKGAPSME